MIRKMFIITDVSGPAPLAVYREPVSPMWSYIVNDVVYGLCPGIDMSKVARWTDFEQAEGFLLQMCKAYTFDFAVFTVQPVYYRENG